MVRKKDIRHFRDLEVYRRAFAPAMEIFQITKSFPAEEKYSLVDQIGDTMLGGIFFGMGLYPASPIRQAG